MMSSMFHRTSRTCWIAECFPDERFPCVHHEICVRSLLLLVMEIFHGVELQLVDFESWKTIFARSEKHSGSIVSQGAVCVLGNSIEQRHEDIKGNIYAFGVLLLELVSGRPPYCKDKGHLVNWVRISLIPCFLSFPFLKIATLILLMKLAEKSLRNFPGSLFSFMFAGSNCVASLFF